MSLSRTSSPITSDELIALLTDDPAAAASLFVVRPEQGGAFVPFQLRPAQKDLLHKIYARASSGEAAMEVILKARRMGVSAAIEYLAATRALIRPNYHVVVVAHNIDAARDIADYFRCFVDHMPEQLKSAYVCDEPSCTHAQLKCMYIQRDRMERRFAWGSRIQVSTAGSPEAERAKGSNFLHLSEAAFYDDPQALISALMPTRAKGGKQYDQYVIVESTASGSNWFRELYEMGKEAEEKRKMGEPTFVAWRSHFYPWFWDDRYRMDELLEDGKLPPDPRFDDEEEFLRSTYGLDDGQLAFRRYVILNEFGGSADAFRIEYPSNDIEAFLAESSSVFSAAALEYQVSQAAVDPRPVDITAGKARLVDSPGSGLYVFKERNPTAAYLIGVDPTVGVAVPSSKKDEVDNAAAVVVTEVGGTLVVVASYQGVADVETFADIVIRLGRYYNDAVICPEVATGEGQHFLACLRRMGYTRIWRPREIAKIDWDVSGSYGWKTSGVTKGRLVSELQAALEGRSLIVSDRRIISELESFARHAKRTKIGGSWRYAAVPGKHDDMVMALGIALCAWIDNPPRSSGGFEQQRYTKIDDPTVREFIEAGYP
ncbi:MAG: hypothetical protein QXZ09_07510, partial [Candidatus Methanomethylicaceae archaeon]